MNEKIYTIQYIKETGVVIYEKLKIYVLKKGRFRRYINV